MITLLVLFNICHWLADYTHLSTKYMLDAKKFGKPLFPIFVHAAIHAGLMGIVLVIFRVPSPLAGYLYLFQIGTHFLIDVWKGRMNGWFPALQNPANKFHWWIFGLDQLLHQIVIIIMAYFTTYGKV